MGVSESKKTASQPLERKRGVSFEQLLEQIAMGRRDEDAISSLAARLAALDRKLEDEDRRRIAQVGGAGLRDLANALLDAIDPDVQAAAIEQRHGSAATAEQEKAVITELMDTACRPFDRAELRRTLIEAKRRSAIVIDEVTTDEVLHTALT